MLRPTLAITAGLFLAACTTVEVWPPAQSTPGGQVGKEAGGQPQATGGRTVTFAVSEEGEESMQTSEMGAGISEDMSQTQQGGATIETENLNIVIGDDLRTMCKMPEADGSFDIGSAKLSQNTKSALKSLASCLERGDAAKRKLRIIGYTDPRGSADFNMELGQRRAEAVASQLRSDGIADDRIMTESRGESEATGTDDASWAKDRKVEISLAE